jgi:hypothetical protein
MSDPARGNGQAGPPAPRKRNNVWIWYFVVLVALSFLAAGALVVVNLRQQLRPEQLEAARERWREKGPASYQLIFTRKIQNQSEQIDEEFAVRVRDRTVESLTLNGRPLEERLRNYYSMPSLFDQIEEFLEKDSKPGAERTYARARFSEDDGHLLEYVRRVMGKRDRTEIHVDRFEPLP